MFFLNVSAEEGENVSTFFFFFMFSFFTVLVAVHLSVRNVKLCTYMKSCKQMILMMPLCPLIKLEYLEEDWPCGWPLASLGTEHTDRVSLF